MESVIKGNQEGYHLDEGNIVSRIDHLFDLVTSQVVGLISDGKNLQNEDIKKIGNLLNNLRKTRILKESEMGAQLKTLKDDTDELIPDGVELKKAIISTLGEIEEILLNN